MEIGGLLIWTNLEFPPHPKMICAKFEWNWPSGPGIEDVFKFVNVFSLFRNYLPLEKDRALHLNKLDFLSPKDICAKFGWNWSSGSGVEYFYISSMYFRNFVIISPGKRAGPFIWTFFCAKFGWCWPNGSGEEDENVKSLQRQRRRRTTDKFCSGKLTWAFGSGEVKRASPHFWLRNFVQESSIEPSAPER